MEELDLFNLDFSIIGDSPSNVDTEQLKQKIVSAISDVLSSSFANSEQKQKIITLPNRLNFACPYCGDSQFNSRKKRGNLYTGNLFYKCYNTGCTSDSLPFERFIEDFNLGDRFTSSEIIHIRNAKNNEMNFGGYSTAQFTTRINKLDEYAIDRDYLMSVLGLKEPRNTKVGYAYLKMRKQLEIDTRVFGFDEKRDDLYFFNLNAKGDKVISTQIRHLRAKRNEQRFTTYNYSKLIVDFIGIDDPDPDTMAMMDRYGLLYNILRVKMGSPLYVLEGPMDSNHINNSVATMSASTKAYFRNGYYIYDNTMEDDAGRHASMEILKKGFNVFAWSKFMKDYPQFRGLKDINDIMKKDDRFPINDVIPDYFINSEIDLIYL